MTVMHPKSATDMLSAADQRAKDRAELAGLIAVLIVLALVAGALMWAIAPV